MAEAKIKLKNSLENYVKLQYLINTTATDCLRQIFKSEWKTAQQKDWENGVANGNKFITGIGIEIYRKALKIQKDMLESGNLDRWDIPILAQCIKIFKTSGPIRATKRDKYIDIIKDNRNKLSHLGNTEITDDEFNNYWKSVSESLLFLGVPANTLQEARDIDITETKKVKQENLPLPNLTEALKLKEFGNKLFKDKYFITAIQKYSEAINLPGLPFQELAALYSNRSISYFRIGDYELAKSDAKGAVLVHPTWSKGYFRLAVSYEKLQKLTQALKNYELALGLDSTNSELRDFRDHCKHLVAKRAREEHLDPLNFHTSVIQSSERMKEMGVKCLPHELHNSQRFNYMMGLPVGICGEGLRYLNGDGRTQNFEEAARCFAKAAAKGNAEGMYNLGILTKEGKGVPRDYQKGLDLIRQAASQEPVEELLGIRIPNVGVAEAEHSLGLAYQEGLGVPQEYSTAIQWYERAIKDGSGSSCNNLALLYSKGEGVQFDFNMAVALWKLGTYYRAPRCTENLALQLMGFGDRQNAWKWYNFAIATGSLSLALRESEFKCLLGPNPSSPQNVDKQKVYLELKEYSENGPVKHLYSELNNFLETFIAAMPPQISAAYDNGTFDRNGFIIKFREAISEQLQNHRAKQRERYPWNTAKPKLSSKGIKDLFGLKPILIKEMLATEDHIYEGFVLKVTCIEDPILYRPSIPILVEDEEKEMQRVFIYNYSKDKDKILSAFGYGSVISVVNPYFRITEDKMAAIRVDDPSTIFFHTDRVDKNRCRFCGKEKGTVHCRKCKRCFYCSKKCFLDDAKLLHHEYVCKKNIS